MRFALIWLAVVSLFGGELIAGISATVYFSPGGGCTNAIVAVLGEAKQTVLVQAYSLHLNADRQGDGRGEIARR